MYTLLHVANVYVHYVYLLHVCNYESLCCTMYTLLHVCNYESLCCTMYTLLHVCNYESLCCTMYTLLHVCNYESLCCTMYTLLHMLHYVYFVTITKVYVALCILCYNYVNFVTRM